MFGLLSRTNEFSFFGYDAGETFDRTTSRYNTRPILNFPNDVSTWLPSYYCKAKRANARTDSALSTTTIIAFSFRIIPLGTTSVSLCVSMLKVYGVEENQPRYRMTERKYSHLDDDVDEKEVKGMVKHRLNEIR